MSSRELRATSWIARGVARLPAKSLSISVCFSPPSLEHDVYGSPMSNAWSRLTHWWGQKGACADATCHGTCESSRRPRPTARDRRPSAQRKADLLDIAHGNGAQFRRPISVRTLARARRFCPLAVPIYAVRHRSARPTSTRMSTPSQGHSMLFQTPSVRLADIYSASAGDCPLQSSPPTEEPL